MPASQSRRVSEVTDTQRLSFKHLAEDEPSIENQREQPSTSLSLKSLFRGRRASIDGDKGENSKKKAARASMLSKRDLGFQANTQFRASRPVTTQQTNADRDIILAKYQEPKLWTSEHAKQIASSALFSGKSSPAATISLEAHQDSVQQSVKKGKKQSQSQLWQPTYPIVIAEQDSSVVGMDVIEPPITSGAIAGVAGNENMKRRSTIISSCEREKGNMTQPSSEHNAHGGVSNLPDKERMDHLNWKEKTMKVEQAELAPTVPTFVFSQSSNRPNTGDHAPPDNICHAPMPSSGPVYTAVSFPMLTPSSSSSRIQPSTHLRKATVIHSPPMPQPIKNLPTLTNLAGLADSHCGESVSTPGWGDLAREGGPKTPGGSLGSPFWNGPRSPSCNGPRTPGISNFTLHLPSPKAKKIPMTEKEARKARKAMPVMLRQPTNTDEQERDGEVGEAGDDENVDSDDGEASEGNSDDETETKRINPSAENSSAGFITRLLGQAKPKETEMPSITSNIGNSTMKEIDLVTSCEEDTLVSRRQITSPPLPNFLTVPSPIVLPKANGKSLWSLETPSERTQNAPWAHFTCETPKATSRYDIQSEAKPTKNKAIDVAITTIVSTERLPYGSEVTTPQSVSGYFDSQPTSSTTSISTSPRPTDTSRDQASEALSVGNYNARTEITKNEQANQENITEEPARSISGESGDEDDRMDEYGGNSNTNEFSAKAENSSIGANKQVPLALRPVASPSTVTQCSTLLSRPSLYSQTSISMINLPSTASTSSTQSNLSNRAPVEPIFETVKSGQRIPFRINLPPKQPLTAHGLVSPTDWAKPPPTPAAGLNNFNFLSSCKQKGIELKRRRSADDLVVLPPKYESLDHPFSTAFAPKPREEEGREDLPRYWCAVHIEGMLQRKMEFMAERKLGVDPTNGKQRIEKIQARDRSWKRLYFILHGTTLLVYKFDPHRFPLKTTAPVPTIEEEDPEEFLHVHPPPDRKSRGSLSGTIGAGSRRSSIIEERRASATCLDNRLGSEEGLSLGITNRRLSEERPSTLSIPASGGQISESSPTSIEAGYRRSSLSMVRNSGGESNIKDPALFGLSRQKRNSNAGSNNQPLSTIHGSITTPLSSHFQHNVLVKQYSLNKTESGLAADYHKRNNVVRIRADGEQFLLQTESARDTIDWVEAFQAATNVAKDLDERLMPKIITLPRRRRRRNPNNNENSATTNNTESARDATAAERDRERMLREDQEAVAT
ncbi:hypothetical protein L204_100453 [Cryptococcus depauperatus]